MWVYIICSKIQVIWIQSFKKSMKEVEILLATTFLMTKLLYLCKIGTVQDFFVGDNLGTEMYVP